MRTIALFSLGLSLSAVAAPPTFKTFENPLARLTAGPVHFECREPAALNGFGQDRLRFDLTLGKQDLGEGLIVDKLQVSNLQRGIWHFQTHEATYSPLPMPMDLAGGQLIGKNTQYERVEFDAHYQGKPIPPEIGIERVKQFSVTQDIESKVVFARYVDTTVVDHGGPGCKPGSPDCEWRQRTITDSVYLCEAN